MMFKRSIYTLIQLMIDELEYPDTKIVSGYLNLVKQMEASNIINSMERRRLIFTIRIYLRNEKFLTYIHNQYALVNNTPKPKTYMGNSKTRPTNYFTSKEYYITFLKHLISQEIWLGYLFNIDLQHLRKITIINN